jgi:hypothetical protein
VFQALWMTLEYDFLGFQKKRNPTLRDEKWGVMIGGFISVE